MLLTHWFLTSGILVMRCDAQSAKCHLTDDGNLRAFLIQLLCKFQPPAYHVRHLI
jgi:hypothetical protein